jgi:3'-5' exoribonuclease
MHHAYRGGLLEHVVSMAELAVAVCRHFRDLDRDLLLVGVVFHDLGKLHELGAMPVNDYTLVGRLVGHVVLGRDLLRERCAAIEGFPEDLQLLLEHMVLAHQGKKEFSSPVEPMTPEALALHFLDDLDSKLNQLRTSRATSPGVQYHRGLGRYVYLPAVVGEPEEAPEAGVVVAVEPPAAEPMAFPMEPAAEPAAETVRVQEHAEASLPSEAPPSSAPHDEHPDPVAADTGEPRPLSLFE